MPRTNRPAAPYDEMILEIVASLGGWDNFHAHLDRADTLPDKYLKHINTTPIDASSYPLSVKQNLTGDLHRGLAYTEKDLFERMSRVCTRLLEYGTKSLSTCIDVSHDIGKDGLLAWRVAHQIKESFAHAAPPWNLDVKIAPSPIFGFKKGTNRWEIYKEAAQTADFLTSLPEKDDGDPSDGRIGFRNNIRRVVELACELDLPVHFHLDQANDPRESGTLKLIEGLRWMDKPPEVWAIHCISPSGYSEDQFKQLVDGLLEHEIGVIVCPTAALSMRQLRPLCGPIHNSIARVLELISHKVPVRIGTDNIADVFVPQSDGNMLTEIIVLGHAIRFANPHVLAKLGAGVPLNDVDRAVVDRVLREDRLAYRGVDPNWRKV